MQSSGFLEAFCFEQFLLLKIKSSWLATEIGRISVAKQFLLLNFLLAFQLYLAWNEPKPSKMPDWTPTRPGRTDFWNRRFLAFTSWETMLKMIPKDLFHLCARVLLGLSQKDDGWQFFSQLFPKWYKRWHHGFACRSPKKERQEPRAKNTVCFNPVFYHSERKLAYSSHHLATSSTQLFGGRKHHRPNVATCHNALSWTLSHPAEDTSRSTGPKNSICPDDSCVRQLYVL